MFDITVEAGLVLKATLDATGDPEATLRISEAPTHPSSNGTRALRLDLVHEADSADEVVVAPGGTSVLVDPQVQDLLADKTLDASLDAEGRASLFLVGT